MQKVQMKAKGVVHYRGHPLDGAPVQIKERRESLMVGTMDIGPVYGLLVIGGRLKDASFWLPCDKVSVIEEPESQARPSSGSDKRRVRNSCT
jgi:hypothetical protein